VGSVKEWDQMIDSETKRMTDVRRAMKRVGGESIADMAEALQIGHPQTALFWQRQLQRSLEWAAPFDWDTHVTAARMRSVFMGMATLLRNTSLHRSQLTSSYEE